MDNNLQPLVSVAITTYKHEKFIVECIESVLMQKTSFPFELVIGHDASPDNTISILKNYTHKYPEVIRIIDHKENVGLRKNNKSVWTACNGKYIAYLEGDDYWTDQNKLEKQINFLEQNLNYSASFHQVQLKHNDSKKDKLMPLIDEEFDLGFTENLANWHVGTCSFVFRNFLINESLTELKNQFLSNEIFWSDRPLMAFISSLGPYKYFPVCYGVWRQHETNMTKIGDLSSMYRAGGIAYRELYPIFPKFKKELSEQVIRWNLKACEQCIKNSNWITFLKFNFKAFVNIKSIIGLKNYLAATFKILIRKEIYA